MGNGFKTLKTLKRLNKSISQFVHHVGVPVNLQILLWSSDNGETKTNSGAHQSKLGPVCMISLLEQNANQGGRKVREERKEGKNTIWS